MKAGVPTEALVALGESVLAYIEELSAASAEGFAFEQSEQAGEMDRRRVELLELLLHGRPTSSPRRRQQPRPAGCCRLRWSR